MLSDLTQLKICAVILLTLKSAVSPWASVVVGAGCVSKLGSLSSLKAMIELTYSWVQSAEQSSRIKRWVLQWAEGRTLPLLELLLGSPCQTWGFVVSNHL